MQVDKKVIEVFFPTLNGELITYKRGGDYHPDPDVQMSDWAATVFSQGGLCSYGYTIGAALAVLGELEKTGIKGEYDIRSTYSDLEEWEYQPPVNALSKELQSQVIYPDKANPYLPRWMITKNGEPVWIILDKFIQPSFDRVKPKHHIGYQIKEGTDTVFAQLYPILTAQQIIEDFRASNLTDDYSLVRGEPLELSVW